MSEEQAYVDLTVIVPNRTLGDLNASDFMYLSARMLEDSVTEVLKAMTKYPSPDHLVLAFAEEAGELVKACMDVKQKGGSLAAVRQEAVQAIAMALRLVLEGDPTIGLQPSAERPT